MPLYEYQCRKCGHRFEKIQKFSDAPVKKCPECGGAVEQLLSAPAVQFKGSGWYVTDYARKAAPGAGKSEGDGAAAAKPEAGEAGKASGEKTAPAERPKAEPKKGSKR